MPKVQVAAPEQASRVDAPAGSSGGISARAYFGGAPESLQLRVYELNAGAVLSLDGAVIDQIAYVWQGTIEANHSPLTRGSSVIVERGAAVQLTACEQETLLVVFGAEQNAAIRRAGGHVHLLASQHVPRTDRLEGMEGLGGALYSDATCATCRVWLHEMAYGMGDYTVPVHSHSEDEIIFVSEGNIRLGNRLYGRGTALRIASHTKYGFRTGPEGMKFINFRSSSPTFTTNDGLNQEMDEALYWRATVGSPLYVNLDTAA